MAPQEFGRHDDGVIPADVSKVMGVNRKTSDPEVTECRVNRLGCRMGCSRECLWLYIHGALAPILQHPL